MMVWDPKTERWINYSPAVTPQNLILGIKQANAAIELLRNSLSELRSQIKILKKQRDKVETLIKSMKNVADDGADCVNKRIKSAKGYLEGALKGLMVESTLDDAMLSSLERSSSYDREIESALHEMKTELKEINHRIDKLESDIARKERELASKISGAGDIIRRISSAQTMNGGDGR